MDPSPWIASVVGLGAMLAFGIYGQNCGGAPQVNVVDPPVLVDPPSNPVPPREEQKPAACLPPFKIHDGSGFEVADFTKLRAAAGYQGRFELVEAEVHVLEGKSAEGPGELHVRYLRNLDQYPDYAGTTKVVCSVLPKTAWKETLEQALLKGFGRIWTASGIPVIAFSLSATLNAGKFNVSVEEDRTTKFPWDHVMALQMVQLVVKTRGAWDAIDDIAFYELANGVIEIRVRRSERDSVFFERHRFQVVYGK